MIRAAPGHLVGNVVTFEDVEGCDQANTGMGCRSHHHMVSFKDIHNKKTICQLHLLLQKERKKTENETGTHLDS